MVNNIKPIYWVYLFGLIWLTGIAIALFKPDPIIDLVFKDLSSTSPYKLHRFYKVNYKYSREGSLGKMFGCLSEYRGSSTRKPKSRDDVAIGKWLEVKSMKYIIRMKVSSGEAFKFSVTEVDKHNKVMNESDSYAVNCDLALLNS